MPLVFLFLIYRYGLVHGAIKKIGSPEGSRTRKLVWQYFFAAVFAFIVAAITGRLELSRSVAIISAIGVINAFGCYCHWRAYDISMSRTAVMSNLDDIIAISLGYIFLGELTVLTLVLAAGVGVSLASATLFLKAKNPTEEGPKGYLIGWVFGYTCAWGVAMFSLRAFALKNIAMPTFALAWYNGSFLGALFIRFILMGRDEAGPPLTHSARAKVSILSLGIWTSLMLDYWMREHFPITVIQPIQLVAEMSIPAIVGFYFGKATMTRKEILVIVVGLVGVALIAIAFKN